jgi:DNA-binding NtrC family response regulator
MKMIPTRLLQVTSLNIMVVSPNLEVQQAFAGVLRLWRLTPIVAWSVGEAEKILNRHPVSLVFYSDEFAGDTGTNGFIQRASRPSTKVPVVVVSRLDDWERFVSFLRRGALDYVLYPLSEVEIARVVKNSLGLVQSNRAQQVAAAS